MHNFQMKIALVVVLFCVAAVLAETQSEVREKRQTTKPGRFLALPDPKKCVERK